jgi:hypothetical protein
MRPPIAPQKNFQTHKKIVDADPVRALTVFAIAEKSSTENFHDTNPTQY